MDENIKNKLRTIISLPDDDYELFFSWFEKKKYKRYTSIVDCNHVEDYLYFIESGVVRFWVENGEKEVTFDFAFPDTFFSSYASFITRKKSEWNIQALTPIVVWQISYNKIQQCYENFSSRQKIGRMLAEFLFIRSTHQVIFLLKLSPEEKYRTLVATRPNYIQLIPLKYLASYIGITPQALSRIRRRIY